MKKILLITSLLIILGFGCTNDNVAELENRIDLLEKKQSRMQMIFEINNGFSVPNYTEPVSQRFLDGSIENSDELLLNNFWWYSGELMADKPVEEYLSFNDFLELEDDKFIEAAMKLFNYRMVNVIAD